MIEILEEKVMQIYKSDKPRKCVKVKCSKCQKEFWRIKKLLKRIKGNNVFCSNKCMQNRVKVKCAYCKIEFEKPVERLEGSKSGLYFCCREHKDLAQQVEFGLKAIWPEHYKDGSWGKYRNKALKEYEHKCSNCGNQDLRILDVHHIDHNRNNNAIDNLIILCRNCHWLETLGYAYIDENRKLIDLGA